MQSSDVILVVDDDLKLCQAIKAILNEVGYETFVAHDGIEALEKLNQHPIRLLLTDIEMPRLNGYQLLQQLRANPIWSQIPLIFLTGRELDSDIRFGKELGADDYLTKPLEVADLLATIKGKLRRFQPSLASSNLITQTAVLPTETAHILSSGELRLNLREHRAWFQEKPISLSAREFNLLAQLMKQPERPLAPKRLVKETHGLETDNKEAGTLLRPLIRSLRRRLGYPVGTPGCIENVRGVGYRLNSTT